MASSFQGNEPALRRELQADEVLGDGALSQGDGWMEIQWVHYVELMELDGLEGDVQQRATSFILYPSSLRNELKDFTLSRSQNPPSLTVPTD